MKRTSTQVDPAVTENDLPGEEELRSWSERRLDEPTAEMVEWAIAFIQDTFGETTVIRDKDLESETRTPLYTLEDMGLVYTKTIQRRNDDGNMWKYFHWILDI